MPSPKVIDLDKTIADDIEEARASRKYVKVKLLGQTWRVTTEPNMYAALGGSFGDIEAMIAMIKNLVHEDEREDFHRALLEADLMNTEVLMKIITGLTEAATNHPTKSPSGSSRSSKTQGA